MKNPMLSFNNMESLSVNQVISNLKEFLNSEGTTFHVSNQLKKTSAFEVNRNDTVERQELWMIVKSSNGETKLEFSIRDFF